MNTLIVHYHGTAQTKYDNADHDVVDGVLTVLIRDPSGERIIGAAIFNVHVWDRMVYAYDQPQLPTQ